MAQGIRCGVFVRSMPRGELLVSSVKNCFILFIFLRNDAYAADSFKKYIQKS